MQDNENRHRARVPSFSGGPNVHLRPARLHTPESPAAAHDVTNHQHLGSSQGVRSGVGYGPISNSKYPSQKREWQPRGPTTGASWAYHTPMLAAGPMDFSPNMNYSGGKQWMTPPGYHGEYHVGVQPVPVGYQMYSMPRPMYIASRSMSGRTTPDQPEVAEKRIETSKNVKQVAGRGAQVPSVDGSVLPWLDKSRKALQKAKEIYEHFSIRCESDQCSQIDQEKMVQITHQHSLRIWDYSAAVQAAKAEKEANRRWSTEPEGQGFRPLAKDISRHIEDNSLDFAQVMYSIDDPNMKMPADEIVQQLNSSIQRAEQAKDRAESLAREYRIPLNDDHDTFLQYGERYYYQSTEIRDHMYGPREHGTNIGEDKRKNPAVVRVSADGKPETSLMLFKQQNSPAVQQDQTAKLLHVSAINEQGKNGPKEVKNIHDKMCTSETGNAHDPVVGSQQQHVLGPASEQPQLSMNTFHANLQHIWFNDGISPRFEGSHVAQASTPWLPLGNEDPFLDPQLEDFMSPEKNFLDKAEVSRSTGGLRAEQSSMKGAQKVQSNFVPQIALQGENVPGSGHQLEEEGRESSAPGNADLVGSRNVEDSGPSPFSCFCGFPCQKIGDASRAYWGCKNKRCSAEIPISSGNAPSAVGDCTREPVNGRYRKPPEKYRNYETAFFEGREDMSGSKRLLEDTSQSMQYAAKKKHSQAKEITSKESLGPQQIDEAENENKKKSSLPQSHESSGKKESGTVFTAQVDPQCKKSNMCTRPNGHHGRCNRRKGQEDELKDVHKRKKQKASLVKVKALGAYEWFDDELLLDGQGSPEQSPGEEILHASGKGGKISQEISSSSQELTNSPNQPSQKTEGIKMLSAEKKTENDHLDSFKDQDRSASIQFNEYKTLPSERKSTCEMVREEMFDTRKQHDSEIPESEQCRKSAFCFKRNGHRGRCPKGPFQKTRKKDQKQDLAAHKAQNVATAVRRFGPISEFSKIKQIQKRKPKPWFESIEDSATITESDHGDDIVHDSAINKYSRRIPELESSEPGEITKNIEDCEEGPAARSSHEEGIRKEKTGVTKDRLAVTEESKPATVSEEGGAHDKHIATEDPKSGSIHVSTESVAKYVKTAKESRPTATPDNVNSAAQGSQVNENATPKPSNKKSKENAIDSCFYTKTASTESVDTYCGQMRHEFNVLSAEYTVAFYGSSRTYPAGAWREQKNEYLDQLKLVQASLCRATPAWRENEKEEKADLKKRSKKLVGLQMVVGADKWEQSKSQMSSIQLKEGSSKIHGNGIFAREDLEKGVCICELLGEFLPLNEIQSRRSSYKSNPSAWVVRNCIGVGRGHLSHPDCYIYKVNSKWGIDGTQTGSLARFINHSCLPNCELKMVLDGKGLLHFCVFAMTKVLEGQEITIDYHHFGGGFTCNCGSDVCRSTLSFDVFEG